MSRVMSYSKLALVCDSHDVLILRCTLLEQKKEIKVRAQPKIKNNSVYML